MKEHDDDKARGVLIEQIEPGSGAEECGFLPGDRIISINGNPVNDAIDYMYFRSGEEIEVVVSRDGELMACIIEKDEFDDPGIVPESIDVTTCKNKCVFCFVHQQPRGMRKSLYLRDDDYRMSFLYGNYITLTNMDRQERERVISQRLSPMYISVHATDPEVRNLMLGVPGAHDVMAELREFAEAGIRLHTQVVLCPGYNDGNTLRRTISDIGTLGDMALSLAIVPVGLTAHRKQKLKEVSSDDARDALDIIEGFQREFMSARGSRLVFGADELYIKAGRDVPPAHEYEEMWQIENGVGMLAGFIADAESMEIDPPEGDGMPPRCLTFTGESFYPYLTEFTERLRARGHDITPVKIANDFFGHSVTVAGLLTGRDIIRQLKPVSEGYDRLIVPDVVLRESDYVFLDDVTLQELSGELKLEVAVVESSPQGLMDGVI